MLARCVRAKRKWRSRGSLEIVFFAERLLDLELQRLQVIHGKSALSPLASFFLRNTHVEGSSLWHHACEQLEFFLFFLPNHFWVRIDLLLAFKTTQPDV